MDAQEIKQHNCAVHVYVVTAAKHHEPISVPHMQSLTAVYFMCAQDTHPSAVK